MAAAPASLEEFNMSKATCKKCRRAGQKLFLKGERCFTSKCEIVKKPYPPGVHGKRRRIVSEYGAQLTEKQKICQIYNIREKQFKRHLGEASKEKGIIGDNLLKKLETRLDNVVFRLGLAESRRKARQLVNHRHISVNNKKVGIPSFQVQPKDVIKIKKSKAVLKKHKPPDWLSLDKDRLGGKVISWPKKENINIPVDIQMVIEYYSR